MISVVVPTYNRRTLLKDCLESLLCQTYRDYEIIVVDDGSTDGTGLTVKNLRGKQREIRYLRQDNSGHSVARNLGFSVARGDIIASIDDDCTAGPDWLEKIDNDFKKYPDIAAAGGSIKNPTDTRIAWSHYILGYSDWSTGMRRRFVRNIPTCNIAYRRELIMGLEFGDDMKAIGYRDSLFNMEVSRRGRILFDPKIKVCHNRWPGGGTITGFLEAQRRHSKGFYNEGYRVHRAGSILKVMWPVNLLCPRLVLVFFRCARSGIAMKFISNLPLIVRGETERWRRHG